MSEPRPPDGTWPLVRWLAGGGPAARRLAEVVLVVVAAVVEIGVTALIGRHAPDQPSLGAAGVALLAVGIAALPLRRRYPAGVLTVVFAVTLAYWSLGYTRGPIWLALIVALVQAVLAGRRRAAVTFLVLGYVAFPWLGYLLDRTERPAAVAHLALAAWLVTLISVAEAIRYRRERAAEVLRSHTEALRRQISEERLRMARELHDAVAHNMSLISIQAGVALHLMDSQPEQARTSLATIKDASKQALVELRSILGVLRAVDEEGAGGGGALDDPETQRAPRAPAPSLQHLGSLVDRARSAGLAIDVAVGPDVGDLAALPRQVDLAAFRIIQESLTNVARHSGSPTASVRLDRRDGGLAIDVLDEGPAAGAPATDLPGGGGNGLVGMRERAASLGGRIEAGPRPGRGFAVRAWLPLDPGTEPAEDVQA